MLRLDFLQTKVGLQNVKNNSCAGVFITQRHVGNSELGNSNLSKLSSAEKHGAHLKHCPCKGTAVFSLLFYFNFSFTLVNANDFFTSGEDFNCITNEPMKVNVGFYHPLNGERGNCHTCNRRSEVS